MFLKENNTATAHKLFTKVNWKKVIRKHEVKEINKGKEKICISS